MSPLIISTSKKRWQLPTRSKHTRYTSLVLASSPILSISALHTGLSISLTNLSIYPSQVIFPALYSFSISHEGESTLPARRETSRIPRQDPSSLHSLNFRSTFLLSSD